jgi:hypothetical protein
MASITPPAAHANNGLLPVGDHEAKGPVNGL